MLPFSGVRVGGSRVCGSIPRERSDRWKGGEGPAHARTPHQKHIPAGTGCDAAGVIRKTTRCRERRRRFVGLAIQGPIAIVVYQEDSSEEDAESNQPRQGQ